MSDHRGSFRVVPEQGATDVMHVRAGGSGASKSMSTFSQGFGWANFDVGLTLPGRNTPATNTTAGRRRHERSRRTSKSKTESNTGTETDLGIENDASCSSEDLLPPTEILITCLCVLVGVSIARQLLVIVFTHFLHKEQPATLFFGAWEGPVLLAQYLALCDSAIGATSLRSLSRSCAHASF